MLHSEICGSIYACYSPQLIAAYHVLRRLPMPRHSPCALFSLTILNYARFSFEDFIVVFFSTSQTFFLCVVFVNTCFPHAFFYFAFLFSFQDSKANKFASNFTCSKVFTSAELTSDFVLQSLCSQVIHLLGGHKWTRTTDLTLIRRAL